MPHPSPVAAFRKSRAAENDPQLVARVREGDEQAFQTIFVAYSTELVAFAARLLGSAAVAEDVVHDVMLQVWQGRTSWVVRDSVRAYLFGAVRNRAIRYLKHERVAWRWREQVVSESQSAPTWTDPADTTDDSPSSDSVLDAALTQAIHALPERCHRVFTLRWQRGLSYAEIAAIMGISVRTVENQLAWALKILRSQLEHWRATDGGVGPV